LREGKYQKKTKEKGKTLFVEEEYKKNKKNENIEIFARLSRIFILLRTRYL
jgi:hypothetical protein